MATQHFLRVRRKNPGAPTKGVLLGQTKYPSKTAALTAAKKYANNGQIPPGAVMLVESEVAEYAKPRKPKKYRVGRKTTTQKKHVMGRPKKAGAVLSNPKKAKIGGKLFTLVQVSRLKKNAKKKRDVLKAQGYNVRITGKTGSWAVYKSGRKSTAKTKAKRKNPHKKSKRAIRVSGKKGATLSNPAKTRTFDGKTFTLVQTSKKKSSARLKGGILRFQGYSVRIVGKTGAYAVYRAGRKNPAKLKGKKKRAIHRTSKTAGAVLSNPKKRKGAPKTRKIGGKTFTLVQTSKLKKNAQAKAKSLKGQGYSARVFGKTGAYAVYKAGRKKVKKNPKKGTKSSRGSLRQASRTRAAVISNPWLNKADKDAIKAFANKRGHLGGKWVESTGKKLLKIGMGGRPLAVWKGYYVTFADPHVKSDEMILRAIRRQIPKNWQENPGKRKNRSRKPKRTWTTGSEVQTLIFPKAQGFTRAKAKGWAKRNGFKFGKVDETGTSYRLRQKDPKNFSTMRTIPMGSDGVKAVIGPLKRGQKKRKKNSSKKRGAVLTNPKGVTPGKWYRQKDGTYYRPAMGGGNYISRAFRGRQYVGGPTKLWQLRSQTWGGPSTWVLEGYFATLIDAKKGVNAVKVRPLNAQDARELGYTNPIGKKQKTGSVLSNPRKHRGHRITGKRGSWKVQPYGHEFRLLGDAKKWINKHVAKARRAL